jgi:hypothetical protein
MIREWSSNFSGTRKPMPAKLQRDCRHSLLNIFINFEQSNSELQGYGAAVKTCMMKFAAEDLFWMTLIAKFWISETNLRLNQLIQYLRDCLLLIRQYCSICMNLLGSNRFICIEFRINWQVMYGKNERSMQGPCCHSCMLPNGTDGIILCLVMSPGFSSIHHHVACGRYREMIWSQDWDLIFRAKIMFAIIWNSGGFYVVDRLPSHTKMNSTYFVTKILILLEQAIFPRGRAPYEKRLVVHLDNCSVHTSRISINWLE